MCACFDSARVYAEDNSEAITKMDAVIEESRWENGHGGYSGTLAEATGACIDSREFETDDGAESYLVDIAQKWGPAVGVKVKPLNGSPYYLFGAWCSE